MQMPWYEQVLQCWFGGHLDELLAVPRDAWFKQDPVFDEILRDRFAPLLARLAAGQLPVDETAVHQVLAWLIVADQFPRNLYRGQAQAFATDAQARAMSHAALSAGLDRQLPPVARWFVYLPLEHSENLADQELAVRCFASLPADSPGRDSVLDYARRHRDVIARFGRFPHRNAALGRTDTPDEAAFLLQPGSRF